MSHRQRIDSAAIDVAAAVDVVYAAFRDHYIEWLPPTGMRGRVLEWDFRDGGRYAVELSYVDDSAGKSGGNRDVARGEFVEVVDGVSVVQTAEFDGDDPQLQGTMRIRWTFAAAADGAHVDVAASDVPAGISAEDHAQGLRSTLSNLKRFVERG